MKFLTYTIVSLLLLLSFSSKAQNAFSVKGAVVDTTAAAKLHNASVLVLRAKDSVMVKFTRVSQDGNFAISNIPGGKYLLLVTYPEYADYTESFSLDATAPAKDFGRIGMVLKAKLLQDIVIKGKATAIKIKGDTTVFNAAAFVVQPNAKVEDLMKQFPGVTVDKDGKISANGKTVEKVLLGGEEFFGDDPTLVTKNIRADMVKEVQMFEKKSDQAAFTGIDDGKKTLTMNVVLKDDKKSGYFGKVDAGVATQAFYSGQVMMNKFQNKEKFAFNATLSNNGRTGLSFQDEQKYGDAGNVTVMDGGGIMITTSGNDLYYDGRGFPISRSGGVHYDNKWGAKDKYTINTNYKLGQLEVVGDVNNINQNNLGTQVNTTISNQRFSNSGLRQKLDAASILTIDSVSNVKITIDGSLRNSTQNTDRDETIYNNDKLQNYSTSVNSVKTDQRVMNASAFYTRKLKKKGRTLSLLLGTTIDNAEREESLYTTADNYDLLTGTVKSSRIVDQKKPGSSKSTAFNSNLTYTEPLTQALSLVVNYGINTNNATSERLAYNKVNGQYDDLDPLVSNSFKLNQIAHQGGAILNYLKGKTTLNFGTRVTDVQFKQDNELKGMIYERHFINWMPQATYQYRFGQQSVFNFNYNGSTQQPSISQLQPVLDNTNPYFQNIGNENLKPSFSNRFNLYYTNYKPLSGQRFYVSGGYAFTTNAFVSNTTNILDGVDQGKTISQTVNTSEKNPYNYNLSINYGRNIWGGVQAALTASTSNNVSFNQVTRQYTDASKNTTALNRSENGSYALNFSLSKYAANKYDLYLSGGPQYSIRKLTQQGQITNVNSKDFRGNAYFGYYLPAKFQIISEATYTYTGAANGLDGFSRTIVTASLSKMFFKSNALKVTASANDLLNQNNGFNRSVNGNQINQNTFTTIKRYFMLSVSWDFNKMGAGTPKQ
ncbi:TonB-dependent receptor [Mucilaginibacter auburnensis]|uniref:Carboxypeptidase family protein n=1 Tax=Mucilaginibacter auburnensis TaxID=1457233 RepID=A0A2H9VSL5_9SPHI|nr:TonB-dependent receptor [Mucilaginibacter auburnensis]PJJ83810.1 carboxypeptidase family protein [Mucilaginibacter auburnensis]